MKKARLKVLGIEAPLNELTSYFDDGYVSTIEEHRSKLGRSYGFEPIPKYYNDGGIILGETTDIKLERLRHIHIYYIKSAVEVVDLSTRAHEETHLLHYVGCLNLLEDRLLKEQGIKIKLEDLKSVEVVAEIGAIYALLSRGIDPHTLLKVLGGDCIREAVFHYDNSRSYKQTIILKLERFINIVKTFWL